MKNRIESLFQKYKIENIACDSRNIKPNTVFFAIKGKAFDGNNFIDEALQSGAIVFAEDQHLQMSQEQIHDDKLFYFSDIRLALALASGIIYPKLPPNLIAVTGTNGKTSVVSYIYQILSLLGYESASIGTIGVECNKKISYSPLKSLTTPDPISFRKILQELAQNNISTVAFEASSHGISQKRLGDLRVKIAGFTSFSQDHLDYHKTMEEYLYTKLQLFVNNLDKGAEVVINREILDGIYGKMVRDFFDKNLIKYFVVGGEFQNHLSLSSSNYGINISSIESSLAGSKVVFEYKNKTYQFYTEIIGSFQVTNILMAAYIVHNIAIPFDDIINVLSKLHAVSGRLERVTKQTDDFQIFVDYAHTPDALEKSLSELVKVKSDKGKLYVVFGCGGERDNFKRCLMGKIACKIADYVIITDDNPRGENPAKIRADILKGTRYGEEIADRAVAIRSTVLKLRKNDILLIAGKGHENYQIIGDKTLYFSDVEVVRNAVSFLE